MCVIYFSTFQPKAPKGKSVGQEKKSSIHIVEKQLKLQERPTNKKKRKSKYLHCMFYVLVKSLLYIYS